MNKKEKFGGKKTSGKAVKIIRYEVRGDESQDSVRFSSIQEKTKLESHVEGMNNNHS